MTRFLALFRRRKPLNVILEDAARAHYQREGVDPYDLAHPIANAADQWAADQIARAMDGDTSTPKRPAVFVEGL